MTKLAYTILVVEDLERARKFYEEYFAQVVEVDMGKLIGFESGLALWEKGDLAQSGLDDSSVLSGRGGMELEFHTENIEELHSRLQAIGVKMVHGVRSHPWQQKLFRCFDLDGHCIEVDEYLWATAKRLAQAGQNKSEIAGLFGVTEAMVEGMLSK